MADAPTATDKVENKDIKEDKEESENETEAVQGQLTKNQKRKLKKKKRAIGKKEEAKKRKVEAVEFVYDPNAIVESVPEKKEDEEKKKEKEKEEQEKEKEEAKKEEEKQKEPEQRPARNMYPNRRVKKETDINFVSEDLANSPFKDLVLQFRQPTTLDREMEVKKFYKTILELMKKSDNKPQDEDDNPAVRMHQMETSCGKLFMLLDRREFPKEILRKLIVIKRKLVMLEYNEAQAEYFDLTIGNAPWPTMLGSKNVLEDEEKRKTLQAIKRLMTFFQETMVPIRTMTYHPLP